MPTITGTRRATNAIMTLLPSGKMFEPVNETFKLLIESFAEVVDEFFEHKEEFIVERDPATSTSLLSQYENVALHPDEMPGSTSTIQERRSVVSAKLDSGYDFASAGFFVNYAAKLGINITIDEGVLMPMVVGYYCVGDEITPQRGLYVWQVSGDVCCADCGNWPKLVAAFNRLKPKHTVLIFTPQNEMYDTYDSDEEYVDSYDSELILEDCRP